LRSGDGGGRGLTRGDLDPSQRRADPAVCAPAGARDDAAKRAATRSSCLDGTRVESCVARSPLRLQPFRTKFHFAVRGCAQKKRNTANARELFGNRTRPRAEERLSLELFNHLGAAKMLKKLTTATPPAGRQ